jgi:hypothetical protein
MHADTFGAPMAGEYVSSGQLVHCSEPVTSLYVPGRQATQFSGDPVKPRLHSQKNDPMLLKQVEFPGQTVTFCFMHSFSSAHHVPFPTYPALHVHKNEPSVSEHVASTWQYLTVVPLGPLVFSHSKRLPQVVPLPTNPSRQSQVNEPTVLVHRAAGLPRTSNAQLCVPNEHSSMSVQIVPFPLNPALHAHEKEPTVSEQAALG